MALSEVCKNKLERGWQRKIPHHLIEYRQVPVLVTRTPSLTAAAKVRLTDKRLTKIKQWVEMALVPTNGALYLDFFYVHDQWIVFGICAARQMCFSRYARNRMHVTTDLLVDQLLLHVDKVE